MNQIKGWIKVVLVLMITYVIIVHSLIEYEGNKYPLSSSDFLIILGARLYGDIPSPSLQYRLDAASEYLDKHQDTKAIVSGGQGVDEWVPEAQAMKDYLITKGISSERLILEERSTNTLENLTYSLDIIKDNKDKDYDVIVVTNKYHIFRAKFLAKRIGLEVRGLPAKTPPSVVIQSYLREYLAILKSWFFDW